jgi:hypothetical protein
MNWTIEQVTSFAPDEGSVKRGKSIAKLNKWQVLHQNDRAIWGECKGSDSQPYRTGVDLNGPAFKCSCPVRKPPCKHVIALMLLRVSSETEFKNTEPAEWMQEWLTKRDAKVEKPKVSEEPEEDAEAKAAAKQAAFLRRVNEMKTGLVEFEIWLKDLIRQGIASVEKESYSFWEDAAARLVDAKAKSASNFIKEIPLLINQTPDWYETVLARLSDLYIITQAIQNIEKLPEPLQHDVLAVAGYTIKKADLLEQDGIKDQWQILGSKKSTGIDPNLEYRKVWLKGTNTNRYALLLDYSFQGQGYTEHYSVGTYFQSEIVYFPSNYPQRARVKNRIPDTGYLTEFDGTPNFQLFLKDYALAIASNPWLMDIPCMINDVIPIMREEKLFLLDKNNDLIPVLNNDLTGWKLLALSGGTAISIFGEWTGSELMPLSAWLDGRFVLIN